MTELMNFIIKQLKKENKSITFIESCTGGGLANALTNTPDSSTVFKGSLVTYSTIDKIRMGVDEKIIKKHGIYSFEVATSMAKAAAENKEADYSISVVGLLGAEDKDNPYHEANIAFICFYNRNTEKTKVLKMKLSNKERAELKEDIILFVFENFKEFISL